MSDESYFAEYPCDWACRIELTLDDIQPQFTHGQMRRAADDAHVTVHAGGQVLAEFTVTNMRPQHTA